MRWLKQAESGCWDESGGLVLWPAGDRERGQCGYPGWCLAGDPPTTGDAGSSVETVPHHLDPSPLA